MSDEPKARDDDEREALRAALAGVKPLSGTSKKRAPTPPEPKATTRAARRTRPAEVEPLRVTREGDAYVVAARRGTHRSILESLGDARLELEAECDLHGMTVVESERAVMRFVRHHQERGSRWVLIVVGKGLHSPGGRASLRETAVDTLSSEPASRYVLAFRTAPRALGGTGALTVRLVDRRRRR